MNPPEEEDWLDGMAGAKVPADALLRREIAALRHAIARRDAGMQPPGDEVGRARLLRRLEQEGVLGTGSSPRSRAPWLVAAATVIGAAIAFQIMRPVGESVRPETQAETPRGVAGVVKLLSADPDATARTVTTELGARGLRATRSPRTDRVILELDVASGQLDAFRAWAEPLGGRVYEPGRYRIIVDRPAPDAAAGPPSS
jgi:hypothetical protein